MRAEHNLLHLILIAEWPFGTYRRSQKVSVSDTCRQPIGPAMEVANDGDDGSSESSTADGFVCYCDIRKFMIAETFWDLL